MPAMRSPEELLTNELKGIHSAERQLSRAIPRLMKMVSSDRLREMLEQRREQGEELIGQIEDVLDEMDAPKVRAKNPAVEGLIEDANLHIEEAEDESLVEPLLVASVQKIEHYCIAAWGTAASMGRLLGQDKVVKVMERVLDEGKEFDEQMTELAESEINPQMLKDGESEEEDEQAGRGKRRKKSR